MTFKKYTLFKILGYEIKADASWFFMAVLISWALATTVYPHRLAGQTPRIYQFMGVGTLVGLMLSIIAHEVAHAVIAEYYKMPITNITLFIFGGVAEMQGEPTHPKGEFLMAVAGPIMSALMGLYFYSAALFFEVHIGEGALSQILDYLGSINMAIAAFNIIPVFPLDGGRALHALLWYRMNNFVLAARISSVTGAIFAYFLMGYGCYRIAFHDDLVGGGWSGILGLFISGASEYAMRQTEQRSLLITEKVARFIQKNDVTVPPDLSITELVDNYVCQHFHKNFPVVDKGNLVGVITLQAVLSLDRHKWPWLHVSSVMEAVLPEMLLTADSNASEAFELMQKHGKDTLYVAEGRRLIGSVAYRDIVNYISITRKIDVNKSVTLSRTAR